jgi:molybdopterin molybdotransferase
MFRMLSVNDAIATLLRDAQPLVGRERIDLLDGLGRTLAEDVVATIDVPPGDNSAMDGYALRHADWPGAGTALQLSQRVTAGSAPGPLQPGSAARIFTGAEIPPGADTVVMQENCEEEGAGVRILQLPAPGANIRRRGQDITAGQRVLTGGRRLRSQDLGLAASLGVAKISAYRRLKVAVLSTGDELVEPGEPAGPGQIYNSNRFTMTGQLAAWGFDVVDLGIARDRPEAVREKMLRAAEEADVIVTSGGVSVGEEDHVKNVVASLGSLDLWRIAVKPGKPFAFGRVLDKPFIGLPGNPVSVFVTLLVVARPYLFACQGMAATLQQPWPQSPGLPGKGQRGKTICAFARLRMGSNCSPTRAAGCCFQPVGGTVSSARWPARTSMKATWSTICRSRCSISCAFTAGAGATAGRQPQACSKLTRG